MLTPLAEEYHVPKVIRDVEGTVAALTAGKLLNLKRLADASGRFRMLAIDQRGSLERALQRALGQSQKVAPEDLAQVKALVTRTLAPYATATLTDPIYGLPFSLQYLPPHVGLLLAIEETGYLPDESGSKGRRTTLLDGWSVQKVKLAGANAVKLLLYYRGDASPSVVAHQQEIVRQVGEACAAQDIPYLLEVVAYPLTEPSSDSPEFARLRPELMVQAAREFSQPHYRVDVLKLEFPADLKYAREYAQGLFDGKTREPLYDLAQVREFCARLNEASSLPWVILSGGVGIEEFLANLQLAVEAGASGFLCGRALWQDALPLFPDVSSMECFLRTEGVYNFLRANAVAEKAVPWESRLGDGVVELAQKGLDWYRSYGSHSGPSSDSGAS